MKNDLINFEKTYWANGEVILGIDEAGYGCLAGSMYIAGVVYPKDFVVPSILMNVKDSKKLSEATRFTLAEEIRRHCLSYFVIEVTVEDINAGNPYWLRFSSVANHINNSNLALTANTRVVYDGDRSVTGIMHPSESLVKGDAKSFSIASASILAKTAKDSEMIGLNKLYPVYSFEKNKGYGTATHTAAIKKHGVCAVHRTQYCSKLV